MLFSFLINILATKQVNLRPYNDENYSLIFFSKDDKPYISSFFSTKKSSEGQIRNPKLPNKYLTVKRSENYCYFNDLITNILLKDKQTFYLRLVNTVENSNGTKRNLFMILSQKKLCVRYNSTGPQKMDLVKCADDGSNSIYFLDADEDIKPKISPESFLNKLPQILGSTNNYEPVITAPNTNTDSNNRNSASKQYSFSSRKSTRQRNNSF